MNSAIHTAESLHPTLADPTLPGAVPTRIAYLDGWRGLAILMVLISHFGSVHAAPLFKVGGYGVDLFFVLSGRLMADLLFVSRHPLPDFFRRRAARILPGFLLYSGLLGLGGLAAYLLLGRTPVALWEYAAANSFTINYVVALAGRTPRYFGHIWSLSVEEHCYLLLALAAFLLRRRIDRAKWVLAMIGLIGLANGLLLAEIHAGSVRPIFWRTEVRLAPLFLSAALFLGLRDAGRIDDRVARLLGWAPLPCVLASLALACTASDPVSYTASALLLAIAVNGLDFSPAWLLRMLSARVLTVLGMLSYSLYIWQQPFYLLSKQVHHSLLLLPAVLFAAMSYHYVERPARRRINRCYFGRPRRVPARPSRSG